MKTFYILSNDELNQLEVTGNDLKHAVNLAMQSDYNALMFFEEYNLSDCYVEEIQ